MIKRSVKCPFCGSCRTESVGGEHGDPFDRTAERTVCLDCGKTVSAAPDEDDLFRNVIRIKMTAAGGGIIRTAKAEFPYEDGEYDLSRLGYPLCRFGSMNVSGDTAVIDGVIRMRITDTPYETERYCAASADSGRPEAENIKISVYGDVQIG